MDTHDFIVNLFESNFSYDIFSKRYSCHEDTLGIIETELIKHFATQEEKEKYDQDFADKGVNLPWYQPGEGFEGFYTKKMYYPKEVTND